MCPAAVIVGAWAQIICHMIDNLEGWLWHWSHPIKTRANTFDYDTLIPKISRTYYMYISQLQRLVKYLIEMINNP